MRLTEWSETIRMRLATITLDVIVGAINKGPFNAGTGTMANFGG